MDSMPSAGQIRTTEVPRHTTSPRLRVSSVNLNGSSGSENGQRIEYSALFTHFNKAFLAPQIEYSAFFTCFNKSFLEHQIEYSAFFSHFNKAYLVNRYKIRFVDLWGR